MLVQSEVLIVDPARKSHPARRGGDNLTKPRCKVKPCLQSPTEQAHVKALLAAAEAEHGDPADMHVRRI